MSGFEFLDENEEEGDEKESSGGEPGDIITI